MAISQLLDRAECELQFTRESALRLIQHLRIDLRRREQLYSFSLYLSMIDYAAGVVALRGTDGAIAIASITRSALDAFVDIENIQRDHRFCDYLEYSSSKDMVRMLKKAKLEENPYLQAIKDDLQFNESALQEAESTIEALEPHLEARRITTECRYASVNRMHEYDAIFRELSGDVHNSVQTAIARRFEVHPKGERLALRPAPHVRFELPCLILIAEALVNASEIVLKMCGHSTAAISEARERVAALETEAVSVAQMDGWSDKQCLAIALDLDTQPRELSCHLPSAWSLLGSVGVPTDAIQAVDLVLYQSAEAAAKLPPQTIFTAAQLIARNGDRANSHGFLMLWRDHAGFADSRWIITVCALDPVIFFFHSRREDNPLPQRESELSAFIESRADDLIHGFLPSSATKIAEEAIEILNPEFSPHWENFTTWHQKLEDHKARAFPVYFEFWGKPGEYIRQLVAHPGVRNNLMPYIRANALDWTCPEVAIPVIEEISGRRPLSGGVVKCSDAFELGQVLQLLLFLYQNMPEDESEPLHAYTRWIELRALSFVTEMAQIYYAAEGMNIPPPPLSTRPEKRMQATQDLATWVEEHLIGGENAVHGLCFTIGCYCALFLDVRLAAVAESEQAQESKSEAADWLRTLLSWILATYEQMRSAKIISDDQAQHYSKIETTLLEKVEIDLTNEKAVEETLKSIDAGMLIGKAVEIILPAADAFFPVVFYSAIDIAPIDIDWKWIKEGVQSMFDAGAKRPAVTLDMSGHIGTLKLEGQFYRMLAEISDPAVEVYFLDQKAGHSMAVKMTWDELMAVFAQKTSIRE